MKAQTLSIDLLKLDGGTQNRVSINEETVEDYAELILVAESKKWPFPPLDVFHDGIDYFVADGFHRTLGAKRAKRASIPCMVHKGTAWDALVFGMGANLAHGLRRTRADKRHAVEMLLDSGKRMTQQQISDIVGVTRQTVSKIIAERKPQNVKSLHSERANDSKSSSDKGKPGGVDSTSSDRTPVADGPASDATAAETSARATTEEGPGNRSQAGERPPADSSGKTGRAAEIETAKQTIKTWMDAVGRWMNHNPGIDVYREQFPGPKGDRVIETAKQFWNAMDAWRKSLK